MSKVPKITLQYLYNISRKKGRMKLIFAMQINKFAFRLVQSVFVGMVSHTQIYPKLYFCKMSQVKKFGMRLSFYADKHQIFLQVDTIIFDRWGQPCLKHSK